MFLRETQSKDVHLANKYLANLEPVIGSIARNLVKSSMVNLTNAFAHPVSWDPTGSSPGIRRGGHREEERERKTPPCQSTSIYGKESQDWSRVSHPYWPSGARGGGSRNNASVHIIHRGPIVGYTLCSVLEIGGLCGQCALQTWNLYITSLFLHSKCKSQIIE